MNRQRLDDIGRLVLRLAVGGLMLFHGVSKLTHGVDRIGAQLAQHGVPRFVSFGVYVGEVIAPLALIAGVGSRAAGLVIVVNMVVAMLLSRPEDIVHLSRTGGSAVELQMLYLLGGATIALLGAGRYSVSRGRGRWD
jgi:putative oxidoreductase